MLSPVVFSQTKTELKTSDLPKPITEFLAKNLKNSTIAKAFKVDSKGVITYDLLMAQGADKSVYIFDKDGKFIKRADRASKPGAPTPADSRAISQPSQHTNSTPKK